MAKMFIAGESTGSSSGSAYDVINPATGEVVDPADRKHLGTIFGGRDMAHGFALGTDEIAFRAEMAVRIDFEFDTAIAEDSFRDHGDHVDAFDFGRDNERCGLVVGVRCTGADSGDERFALRDELTFPWALAF